MVKAITRSAYGGPEVLSWTEVASRPAAAGEVRLRVKAASINAADSHMMRGQPAIMRLGTGLLRPRNVRLGMAVAGEVVQVGEGVSHLAVGQRAFADLSSQAFCGFSEEITFKASAAAAAPDSLTDSEAAALPLAAVTALQALRKAQVNGSESVLITGASGGVGTYLVQLAKLHGAQVTGVTSRSRVALVQSLGADTVIDRSTNDFRNGSTRYDVIIESGGFGSVQAALRTLNPGGRYVFVGGGNGQLVAAMLRGKSFLATASRPDLEEVGALTERGDLKPVIGATFEMPETAEAMRKFESGAVAGKIVLLN